MTVGLHMEDLEEDRRLGPREASEACDLLSMHGYPIYARWADGPTDDELLSFLTRVTSWLGGGRDVLFTEFGLPTGIWKVITYIYCMEYGAHMWRVFGSGSTKVWIISTVNI